MYALHVLLQTRHALQPRPTHLALFQLRLRSRCIRMHKFLMLLQYDFCAHLFATLVANDNALWIMHGVHVIFQFALSHKSVNEENDDK